MVEKTGIEAIWDNKQFTKGVGDYMTSLAKASQATTQTGASATAASQQVSPLSTVLSQVGGASTASTGSMLAMAGGMAVVATAAVAAMGAVKDFITGIIDLGKEATLTASRVQQLNYIAQTVGQLAGYNAEEINGFVDAIRKQGISMSVANQLVIQFARYNLDMASAVKLATVAQDAATIANEGSSDALEGLLHGITTLNVRVLRTHGIMVDSEKAFERYAESIDKTADSLTEQERVQAFVNAVVEAGIPIQGAYQASMETGIKQMGTLTSRLLPDLLATLGMPFQNAFYTAATAINNLVKWVTALISEGGALYPVLINIGAVLDILADAFSGAVDMVTEFGGVFINDLIDTLSDTAKSMFDWGINIATQLAEGLIDGAVSAINAAIEYISNLLSSWFAPGSPPKVAKDIDVWGAETMNEYLKGFGEADYALLDSLQAPIKEALSTLVALGELTGKEASNAFIDLSQQMISAIESGEFTEELYANMEAALGDYGSAVVDLAKKQYELSEGVKSVETAEAELEASRQRAAASHKQVNALTLEYNRLLRAGASSATLAAKKKEIDLAKKSAEEADAEVSTAETNLDVAKETLKVLQAQAAAQEKLVETMLELAKASADAQQEEGGGGGGGEEGGGEFAGGGGGAGAGGPAFDASAITDAIKEAVEKAKQNILDALGGVWDTLKAIWQEKMGPLFDVLAKLWEKIEPKVREVWNTIVEFAKSAWEFITEVAKNALDWIVEQVAWFMGVLKDWWTEHGDSVKAVWDVIKQIFVGAWNVIKGIFMAAFGVIVGLVKTWIQTLSENWDLIQAHFATVWENIKIIFENVLDIFGNLFDLFAAVFRGDWAAAWDEVKQIFENVWNIIVAVWDIIISTVETNWELFTDFLVNLWENIWDAIDETVNSALKAIQDFITKTIKSIGDWIENALNGIKTFFTNIWNSIKTTIETVWTNIKTWLETTFQAISDDIADKLNTIFTFWSSVWDSIKEKVTGIWDTIKTTVETAINTVKTTIDTVSALITAAWDTFWDAVSSKISAIWTTIQTNVGTAIDQVKTTIETKIDALKLWWDSKWDEIQGKVTGAWETVKTDVGLAVSDVYDSITGAIKDVWDDIQSYIGKFTSFGGDIISGMVEGIVDKMQSLIDAVIDAIKKALEAAKGLLESESPSKVFAELGAGTMIGMAQGIMLNAEAPERAVSNAMMGTVAQAANLPIVAGAQTRNAAFNFGGVTMQSPIDLAMFEATIRKVVKSEMGAI